MKFLSDKTALSEVVLNASKATAVRSSIPALEGIKLTIEGNELTATGYDLEMGIKSKIEVEGIENGEIVVNAKIFGEMIRKMPAKEKIQLETFNDSLVKISSGDTLFEISGVSGNEYPNVPELNHDASFKIRENVFKSMIGQTIHALSTSDLKPVHTGSKFEIKDDVLSIVSVDGIRMARRVEPVKYNDISFVAPGKTLNEILRIMSDDETEKEITVCIDRNQICFFKDDYMIISRLLDGEFINYEKIMGVEPDSEAVVKVSELASSLDRTLLLLSERFQSPVICTFENDTCFVSCKTNVGEITDKVLIKYGGPKVEIAFKARLMIDALKNSLCDEVKLQFKGPLAPIKIVPLGDEYFTFLVLPVRLK